MSLTRLPARRLTVAPSVMPDADLEWLITNGLGGYASGPVGGGLTRRFHGLLIASLPAPLGRVMCLNLLRTTALVGDRAYLVDHERMPALVDSARAPLLDFMLDGGLPVWRYAIGDMVLERRIVMRAEENTTHVLFTVTGGPGVRLRLQPAFQLRPHEGLVTSPPLKPSVMLKEPGSVELDLADAMPRIRWRLEGAAIAASLSKGASLPVDFPIENARGYDHSGHLWSPGWFDADCCDATETAFTVSTEPWDVVAAISAQDAWQREVARRDALLSVAGRPADPMIAELILASDQFITVPTSRASEVARARAAGDEPRTVVAGYHWFTDWGRDTMISLEGLTLATGRIREAGCLLRTFGHYVREGLIPNMFPEGEHVGLYHTADATLWFFHALHRYVERSGDVATLTNLLPTLVDIAERHVAGTRFGIHVDPTDGLLHQGAEGYQLTWMDAKVGDWVVTPRRGKAVEINALWYNALMLLAQWLSDSGRARSAETWRAAADRTRSSFNERFWSDDQGHLFDVVDGEGGDDAACRPNQLFAMSLDYPVLDPARWSSVLDVVTDRLLTPVGLRSLDPSHPDYQARYDGDLHARDAAYHQGTVWAWLIGPYVDAWLRVHPGDHDGVRRILSGFGQELSRSGVGSISEIFDAEPPYTPRGCIAQAWSVAEVLRCWRRLETRS